jgi:tripartite-type tricarboxylate transporter receptor subunit TctC
MAAVAFAAVPASAARMEGCSGSNLMKTETAIEAMADGDAKWVAYKEMTDAQTALLDGKMGACAVHLTKAAHMGMGMMK